MNDTLIGYAVIAERLDYRGQGYPDRDFVSSLHRTLLGAENQQAYCEGRLDAESKDRFGNEVKYVIVEVHHGKD